MCNAGTASLGAQAFGVGMQTVGAFASAKAQQASLRSQARIAEINATLADAAARAELMASERQQNQIKLRGSQVKASQKAAYAANGVDVGVGTPVNVATSTDFITEVDANTAAANGIQAAWGRRIEAGNLRNEALMARATADGISPGIAAFTSLATGAGQVAQSWYSLNKAGALSNTPSTGGTGKTGGGSPPPVWGQPGHEGSPSGTYIGTIGPGGMTSRFPVTRDGIKVRW